MPTAFRQLLTPPGNDGSPFAVAPLAAEESPQMGSGAIAAAVCPEGLGDGDAIVVEVLRLCLGGRTMEKVLKPHDEFCCDRCKEDVAEGDIMYGCRECNADFCQGCWDTEARKAMPQLHPQLTAPFSPPPRPLPGDAGAGGEAGVGAGGGSGGWVVVCGGAVGPTECGGRTSDAGLRWDKRVQAAGLALPSPLNGHDDSGDHHGGAAPESPARCRALTVPGALPSSLATKREVEEEDPNLQKSRAFSVKFREQDSFHVFEKARSDRKVSSIPKERTGLVAPSASESPRPGEATEVAAKAEAASPVSTQAEVYDYPSFATTTVRSWAMLQGPAAGAELPKGAEPPMGTEEETCSRSGVRSPPVAVQEPAVEPGFLLDEALESAGPGSCDNGGKSEHQDGQTQPLQAQCTSYDCLESSKRSGTEEPPSTGHVLSCSSAGTLSVEHRGSAGQDWGSLRENGHDNDEDDVAADDDDDDDENEEDHRRGKRRVTELKSIRGRWSISTHANTVVTVEEGGKTFYGGRYEGDTYDLSMRPRATSESAWVSEGGVADLPEHTVVRGDGWAMDQGASTHDRLVWVKPGKEPIQWHRVQSRGGGADDRAAVEVTASKDSSQPRDEALREALDSSGWLGFGCCGAVKARPITAFGAAFGDGSRPLAPSLPYPPADSCGCPSG
mmetsp:Transcript_4369/g.16515  ORF Transcript_4369/g.16515 Transcript_4369/m.16515 type:complete len:671 (-) Transcript_4369:59-2071(-)